MPFWSCYCPHLHGSQSDIKLQNERNSSSHTTYIETGSNSTEMQTQSFSQTCKALFAIVLRKIYLDKMKHTFSSIWSGKYWFRFLLELFPKKYTKFILAIKIKFKSVLAPKWNTKTISLTTHFFKPERGLENRNRTDAYLKTENFHTWKINCRMTKFNWKVTENIWSD